MSTTPNMSLNLPTVSITLGPQWASQLNTALGIIDQHDHSSGKGVKITPAGLNINTVLNINSQHIQLINSTRFINNSSTLATADDIRSLYVVSGDLYYNNQSGAAVQITSGGGLNSGSFVTNIFPTTAVTTDTTILASDTYTLLEVDSSSAITISLPAANGVSDGRFYIIKDVGGQALTNNITITPFGSDIIDGVNAAIILDSNYGSLIIASDGLSKWSLV